VTTYERIAGLPLEIDSYELVSLEEDVSSGFTRRTTVVHLRGGGEEGVGEDVTYSRDEQILFEDSGSALELVGEHTIDTFSGRIGEIDLFPTGAPEADAWRRYRRWAFESAALDLALRQSGRSLADALGRSPGRVCFVVSKRLPSPPTVDPLRRLLASYPGTRLKLDPTSEWTAAVVEELSVLDAVDIVDLKAAYRGTAVDQPTDPALYARVAEGFPTAIIEDPDVDDPEARAVLEPYRDRISWDAIIHSVADVEALPFPPKTLNVKPSRFGSLSALFATYDYCERRSIQMYGGGQFELGPGRGQIQYLASLFHPDGPNDVAPKGYNAPEPAAGLETSPLAPAITPTGFCWA